MVGSEVVETPPEPSESVKAARAAGPVIEFDDALPISAWHDEIMATIRDHQVVIIAGETGSGKTTQIPKICLELGRRSIAHTQPRRIAARTVAERIADELKITLGQLVGYQVRFTRQASRATRLKIMTDGVLLAEIGHDRDLRRYDTIIIDEAHERSLNIDFLLGYLKQLLAWRRDLKVIVTSATIDTDRFSHHFAGPDGIGAPIIEVSGRTFPVETRYRPLLEDGEADQIGGIVDAVAELSAVGGGDILVFLSGEREIRDTADALVAANLRSTEILPLYARLSAADQHRVFAQHAGRRVVLSTNVAETSLTVPGIRYVVDAGTARISRYSSRTKVQRLPIEPISQASANQRAGRCGRVAPGVCIRLYSEEDFLGRPAFTEPEILRTNLASVILQMTAADLGEISSFPFVEAPDNSQIADGIRLLHELGALTDERERSRPELTPIGRQLAALPVDPRMGRMLIEGDRQGALRELLVVVAGLSIQDPRERPAEQREKADALHRRFWAGTLPEPVGGRPSTSSGNGPSTGSGNGPSTGSGSGSPPDPDGSDFVAWVRLWDYLKDAQRDLSGNAFRRLCRDEFLHFLRIREWQDLHTQLKQISREIGLHRSDQPASADRLHTAALAGLLSHVGLADMKDEAKTGGAAKGGTRAKGRRPTREYLGARGTKFAINPGSSVAKVGPPLVVAAEIVETNRLWARTVAPVTAGQIEEVGQHLLKRTYSEPHWSARAGAVMAYEQVSLYGVPIVGRRPVPYARVNPAEARQIFIRAALVEGDWRTRHHFFRDNQALRTEVEALEERTRRRDLMVDDETIFSFYDARVPAEATTVAHFDAWWKKTRQVQPDLLSMTFADLTTGDVGDDREGFPDAWVIGPHILAVDYVFEPGSPRDGVSVTIPVSVLNQLTPEPFSWQVPGLRSELAAELIRSLPKSVRRQFVPAPEFAARALGWLAQHPASGDESLPAALGRALRALTGEQVPADAWAPDTVPSHLRVVFDVVSDAPTGQSRVLGTGPDLDELKQQLARQVNQTLSAAASEHTRTGLTRWDFDTLPAEVVLTRSGNRVVGYPALVDEGATVGVQVFDTPERQAASQGRGLRRLVLLNTPDPTKWVVSHLSNTDKLALGQSPYASVPALLADARLASVGELVRRHRGPFDKLRERGGGELGERQGGAFTALCDAVRMDNADLMRTVTGLAAEILAAHRAGVLELPQVRAVSPDTASDLTEQLGNLVFDAFLSGTPYGRLTELPRYLQAVRTRIGNVLANPGRDQAGLAVILRVEDAYAELAAAAPPGRLPDFVEDVGWLLEELRVSLFAQPLRTRVPVSEKRVLTAIAQARTRLG